MIRSAWVVNNGWLLFFSCSQQRRCSRVQRHGWFILATRSGVSWLFLWPRRLLPHYLFDSELTGAPRQCVFGGCVFSYYTPLPYRTPSEPAPLFNDVSVLLPQSLSSLLTSWLPLSLLFLWRRPPELNIAEVPSVDYPQKRPSSNVIQLRTESTQTQNLTWKVTAFHQKVRYRWKQVHHQWVVVDDLWSLHL